VCSPTLGGLVHSNHMGSRRWRREYGGLNKTRARKLKELEKEITRLKRLVADLSLDNAILKEVLSKK
jgi:putative transposase